MKVGRSNWQLGPTFGFFPQHLLWDEDGMIYDIPGAMATYDNWCPILWDHGW